MGEEGYDEVSIRRRNGGVSSAKTKKIQSACVSRWIDRVPSESQRTESDGHVTAQHVSSETMDTECLFVLIRVNFNLEVT